MWNDVATEDDSRLPYAVGVTIGRFWQFGQAAISVLRKKLKSKDRDERCIAVDLLGRTGRPEVTDDLQKMLDDPEEKIRLRAIRALGYVGSKPALDAVAKLADSANVRVLDTVVVALSRNGDQRAIQIWERLLKLDNGSSVAWNVTRWLAKYSPSDSMPILLAGLAHGKYYVRTTCHDALRRHSRRDFGFKPKMDLKSQQQAIEQWRKWWGAAKDRKPYEVLLDAVAHGSEEDRNAAFVDLVKLGDRRAIPDLLKRQGSDLEQPGFNEKINVEWGLRILSARVFDSKDDWVRWWRANRAKLPRHSPLIVPFAPLKEVTEVRISVNAEHVSVDDNLMFVGTRGRLEVYDISDIRRPEIIGRYKVQYQGVEDLVARDGRLYLTTHQRGLHVYAYSAQGDELAHVSSHEEVRYAGHVTLQKQRLLVGSRRGAALYDISGKGPPRLLDKADWAALGKHSVSDADGFFTTAQWHGDKISTENSFPMRTVQGLVHPDGTAVSDGKRFYCLDHGLLIVRDMKTGKLLGRAPARARYDGTLLIDGDRLFALLDDMGIVVYDVSDPKHIKVLSHTPLPGQPRHRIYRGFHLANGYLFCANYQNELRIFALPKDWRKRGQATFLPKK